MQTLNLPGKLIAVEGLDGSGKSTQLKLLYKWLKLEGHKVYLTEWNSSPVIKEITKYAKKKKALVPLTFSLMHCADFTDRYERQLLPLLKAGYFVLFDRYVYTAFVRDTVRGCDLPWVKNLYSFAVKPDITFFFDVPLDVALNRIMSNRSNLKFYEAGMDITQGLSEQESFKVFQKQIYDSYIKIVKEYNLKTVNALLPPEIQQKSIREIIKKRFL